MTDTAVLRKAIEKSGLKQKYIAARMGLSPYGLQKKIENDNEFKASEIAALSEILGLSFRERDAIFFARAKVGFKSANANEN